MGRVLEVVFDGGGVATLSNVNKLYSSDKMDWMEEVENLNSVLNKRFNFDYYRYCILKTDHLDPDKTYAVTVTDDYGRSDFVYFRSIAECLIYIIGNEGVIES